jgi:hypothetical protein
MEIQIYSLNGRVLLSAILPVGCRYKPTVNFKNNTGGSPAIFMAECAITRETLVMYPGARSCNEWTGHPKQLYGYCKPVRFPAVPVGSAFNLFIFRI